MRNLNNDKGRISNKIDNLQQLQYIANQEIISELINEWCESHPNNEKLTAFRTAWINTIFYINKLELDRSSYGTAYSQMMDTKNKEINRLGELLSQVVDENIELDDNIIR